MPRALPVAGRPEDVLAHIGPGGPHVHPRADRDRAVRGDDQGIAVELGDLGVGVGELDCDPLIVTDAH